jgi:hypothetical protein
MEYHNHNGIAFLRHKNIMPTKVKPSNLPKDGTVTDTTVDAQQPQKQQQSLSASLIEILDSDKSPEYAAFKLKDNQTITTSLICAVETITYGYTFIYMTTPDVPILFRLATYFRMIVPCLGWVYLYLLKKHVHSNVLTTAGKRVIQLGNAVILMQAVCASLMLLTFALTRDDCHSDKCLQDFPKKIIPLGMVFHQFLGSISLPLLITCHDVSVSLLSVFISVSMCFVGAVLLYLPFAELLYIAVMGVVTFFCLASYESKLFSCFASFCKFETTLRAKVDSENKEYLMKNQAEEMRHMIGTCRCNCRLYVYWSWCDMYM